jgi:hypothetical protein
LHYSKNLALVSTITSLLYVVFPFRKLHALVIIVTSAKMLCDLTMVTQQSKESKTIADEWSKSCTQITNLNLNQFKMVEEMRLKIAALRSP